MMKIRWDLLLFPLMVWLMEKNCGFIARKYIEVKDGCVDWGSGCGPWSWVVDGEAVLIQRKIVGEVP